MPAFRLEDSLTAHPMPLSTRDLQALAELLEQALALPAAQRAGWLAALPDDAQPLRDALARALAAAEATGADRAEGPEAALRLPALPGLFEDTGDDADTLRAGDRVGAWRLLSELGRGGMGRVWRAERADGLYDRVVALKLPRLARSASLTARMALERQIGARLEHPHIARLYDAGLDERGRPFLVMERVEGLPITEHADAARLGLEARLRLLLQVCDAVAHAHRQLVVHRDIKPANVLVDPLGAARLLDFGVARLHDDGDAAASAGSPTLSASPLGLAGHTPRYAAPEQRRGEAVSTATDVWALALLGFELLSGPLPREGPKEGPEDGPEQGARRRPSEAPFTDAEARCRGLPTAAALRQRLRGGLDAVIEHALADDPQARPRSADALAQALQAVLAHRVPDSWAAPWPARLALLARRRARPLLLGAVALLGVGVAVLLLLQEQARTRAEEARLDQARRFMLDLLWQAEPAPGQAAAALTTAQLLDATVARARRQLVGEPLLQADVLHEAAVLARHIGRGDSAEALLREALALAQQGGPGSATRHIVAAQLAVQLDDGNADATAEAERLATGALQGCRDASRRCATARAYATTALSAVQAARGDDAGAVARMQESVAAHVKAFGPDATPTAWQRLNLATRLRNAERWAEALAEVERAADSARRQPLSAAEQTRLSTLQALLQADLGRHAQALDTLAALLATMTPGSSQRALAERLRAQSAFAMGQLDVAVAAADAVLGLAATGGSARESAIARQTRLRALAAQGRHDEAWRDWQAAEAAITGMALPAEAVLPQRQQRLAAELALQAGRPAEARARLTALLAMPRQAAATEGAQALDLLGAAERASGNPAAARALHERASAMLQRLPDDHPLRLRNRLDQAWAAALSQPATASPDPALAQAAAAWVAPLPADSAWRPLVKSLLADPRSALLLLP